MSKYHMNPKGVASICKAAQGNCPFGGESDHQDFSTTGEAQTWAEEKNAAEAGGSFGSVFTKKKTSTNEHASTTMEKAVGRIKEIFANARAGRFTLSSSMTGSQLTEVYGADWEAEGLTSDQTLELWREVEKHPNLPENVRHEVQDSIAYSTEKAPNEPPPANAINSNLVQRAQEGGVSYDDISSANAAMKIDRVQVGEVYTSANGIAGDAQVSRVSRNAAGQVTDVFASDSGEEYSLLEQATEDYWTRIS
jgi:hypothetical protein